jgi:hypothetical protein
MGLIVTNLRNRLAPEKANKLVYIYMNQRVLDKAGDLLLGDWVEKSDTQQVDLEGLLLPVEQESEDEEEGDDIEL